MTKQMHPAERERIYTELSEVLRPHARISSPLISQYHLAKLAGMPRSSLTHYRHGRQKFSDDALRRLHKALVSWTAEASLRARVLAEIMSDEK